MDVPGISPSILTLSDDDEDEFKPRVYRQRWLQLAYLALLALLSDWVCFSVAAVPDIWCNHYGHKHEVVMTIFLYTNVAFCFLEPIIVARHGLRKVVVGASFLMSLGCICRSGLGPLGGQFKMPSYLLEVVGTVLVGAAQPFFQCTPPLLSAVWFAPDERVLATSIAINSNQIGIGVSFLVGAAIAGDEAGLCAYFTLITCLSLSLSVGVYCQFQDEPPSPPSNTAAMRTITSSSFPRQVTRMLRTRGFLQALATFMASISITNAVSTEVARQLQDLSRSTPSTSNAVIQRRLGSEGSEGGTGVEGQGQGDNALVMIGGAGFQLAIMFGSIVLGKIVDTTKWYKCMICFLMTATMLLLIPNGYPDCYGRNVAVFMSDLWLLGSCVGPVQPISAELAVEVAYPTDENAIVAFQQVCGNLFSAITLPILTETHDPLGGQLKRLNINNALLEIICVGGLMFILTFFAPLKRALKDAADKGRRSDASVEMEGYQPMDTSPVAKIRAANGQLNGLEDGFSSSFSHSPITGTGHSLSMRES